MLTGEQIKEMRIKLGITQAVLAEWLGFGKAGNIYISALEHNRKRISKTGEKLLLQLLKEKQANETKA